MPRDPRIKKLERLRSERWTRPAGSYHGTRATAYVTIIPGWRAEQVAAALERRGVARSGDVMREILRGGFSTAFLADRPAGAGVEGYLMPDTYIFRRHGGARYAIARILNNFGRRVTPADVARGNKLHASLYRPIIPP